MKVLLDTNVILDVWMLREPFWKDSAALLAKVETKEVEGWICPTSITTLHYLSKKALGEQKARLLLEQLICICKVAPMSRTIFKSALESDIKDFEDAVIEAVSIKSDVEFIATRNVKDFKMSKVPAKEPAQLF